MALPFCSKRQIRRDTFQVGGLERDLTRFVSQSVPQSRLPHKELVSHVEFEVS